jgi:multidrug efflux system membrane fusion protein
MDLSGAKRQSGSIAARPGSIAQLLIWGVLFTLMAGCGHEEKYDKPAMPVGVRAVESYSGAEGPRYSANIQPYAHVELAFKVGGYVVKILPVQGVDGKRRHVQPGDLVKRDVVLAQVRQIDYETKLKQAQAQLLSSQAALTKAALDLERAIKLYAANSLTKSDYDTAQARYGEAQGSVAGVSAQVEEARLALKDSSLKTPMAGLVLQRKTEVGDLVGPGHVGFVLANTQDVKVVFGVSDMMLRYLKMGEALTVTTEALRGREFKGLVTAISPSADPKSRVFDIQITIPNLQQELKVGMIASVEVPMESRRPQVAVVPLSAIVRSKSPPEGYALFVVEAQEGKQVARRRDHVRLGEVYGNLIAVVDGVKIGEQIIVTGSTLVEDGQKVRVIPPSEQ